MKYLYVSAMFALLKCIFECNFNPSVVHQASQPAHQKRSKKSDIWFLLSVCPEPPHIIIIIIIIWYYHICRYSLHPAPEINMLGGVWQCLEPSWSPRHGIDWGHTMTLSANQITEMITADQSDATSNHLPRSPAVFGLPWWMWLIVTSGDIWCYVPRGYRKWVYLTLYR